MRVYLVVQNPVCLFCQDTGMACIQYVVRQTAPQCALLEKTPFQIVVPPETMARWLVFLLFCCLRWRESCSFASKQHARLPQPILWLNSETRNDLLPTLPPPPDPTSNPNDDVFRMLRETLPLPIQHWMRDSGFLRGLTDGLVYFSVPELIQRYPHALGIYLSLPVKTIA